MSMIVKGRRVYHGCVQENPGKTSLSTAGGLVAIALWSTTFAVARSLSEKVGPLTAGAAVYLVGGALCLARVGWSKGGFRQALGAPRRYLLGCGFLFVLYTVVIYLAVGLSRDREQVLEIALVNYLWPAATIVLSLPLLKLRAKPLLWPGTAVALGGIFLVVTHGAQISWAGFRQHVATSPAAYALALTGAVSWALYSNLTRRWAGPGSSGAAELFIPATGMVLLGLRYLVSETTAWNARAAGEACLLGAITALAYVLWDGAMRRGNLLRVAVCSYFTPLLSTLVSCVYLEIRPGPRLWVGTLLLVAGSMVTWRSVAAGTRGNAGVGGD